jgi:hypothetical protein
MGKEPEPTASLHSARTGWPQERFPVLLWAAPFLSPATPGCVDRKLISCVLLLAQRGKRPATEKAYPRGSSRTLRISIRA